MTQQELKTHIAEDLRKTLTKLVKAKKVQEFVIRDEADMPHLLITVVHRTKCSNITTNISTEQI